MANEFDQVKNIFEKTLPQGEELYSENDILEIKNRSKTITSILTNYKVQQNRRNEYKENVKKWFVPIFSGIAVLFVLITIAAVVLSFVFLKEDTVILISSIVSSLIAGFTSVVTILVIITKYIFPSDEEKNFNHLISIIVKNDTERLNQIHNEHSDFKKSHEQKQKDEQ